MYYHNPVLREVPFKIKKEFSCDCSFPTTYNQEIRNHVQRGLTNYAAT